MLEAVIEQIKEELFLWQRTLDWQIEGTQLSISQDYTLGNFCPVL